MMFNSLIVLKYKTKFEVKRFPLFFNFWICLCIFASPWLIAEDQQKTNPTSETVELDVYTVIATKKPRLMSEVASVVTVIDDDQIYAELAQNMDELVRYEPDVDVNFDAARFGQSGFNIRGISDNRIAIEIDGVPMADRFAIGNFADSGQNYIDTELLKRVEILRGPASSLYGSNAIGGVVTFETKDPSDYLTNRENRWHLDLKGSYHSATEFRCFTWI